MMFRRQTNGSCICVFCNHLISVNQATCPHCHSKNPSLYGYSRSLRRLGRDLGFTAIVIWGCIALYLTTLLIDLGNINSGGAFDFLAPSQQSLIMFGASGAIPVFERGNWWSLLSSGWLHGGLMHIAFNLLWIRNLAFEVAQAFGSGRLVIIYTVATVISSLLSSLFGYFFQELPPILHGAQVSFGASGGLFGLLGALVAYGQITRNFTVRHQALMYAVVMFLLGFVNLQIDNWGHFGGFFGGYLVSRVLDPRYREGMQHLFLAIICLALTALSILASIVNFVIHPVNAL